MTRSEFVTAASFRIVPGWGLLRPHRPLEAVISGLAPPRTRANVDDSKALKRQPSGGPEGCSQRPTNGLAVPAPAAPLQPTVFLTIGPAPPASLARGRVGSPFLRQT